MHAISLHLVLHAFKGILMWWKLNFNKLQANSPKQTPKGSLQIAKSDRLQFFLRGHRDRKRERKERDQVRTVHSCTLLAAGGDSSGGGRQKGVEMRAAAKQLHRRQEERRARYVWRGGTALLCCSIELSQTAGPSPPGGREWEQQRPAGPSGSSMPCTAAASVHYGQV
jgi:hypothetical protein